MNPNISDKFNEVIDRLIRLRANSPAATLNDIVKRLAERECTEDDPLFRNPFANKNGYDPIIERLIFLLLFCDIPLSELADNLLAANRSSCGITVVWPWLPDCQLPCAIGDIPVWHVQLGKYADPNPD
jgi:hypothetical protein